MREQLASADLSLLTLVGPPGVGKTRLALALVERVADLFVDGVVVVPLASIATAEGVGPAIAQALGIVEPGSRPLVESLADQLRERAVLLVLDNFEHVVSASSLLAELLSSCAGLKLLVTSRVPTRNAFERAVVVKPLGLPTLAGLPPIDELAAIPSVALFLERARALRSDFALTPKNAASVAEICVRLDGLPLAIELAAARIRVMGPPELLDRLSRALPLLARGPGDAISPRHQTLRDAISWSHDLLGPTERVLFRRLAVFAGGWTLGAAEAVCESAAEAAVPGRAPAAGPDLLGVLDGLTTLVEQSLVERDASSDEQVRFRMLETVRAFALEMLVASGEEQAVRRRHAEHVLSLVDTTTTGFMTAENVAALARLDDEQDNVRAALQWCAGADGSIELGLRMVAGLYWYWYARGHFVEARRWIELMLSLASAAPAPDHARAWVFNGAATMAWRQADYETATRRGEQALAAFRAHKDDQGVGLALVVLGVTAMFSGDFARAQALMDETLAHGRASGNEFVVSSVLHNLARLAWFEGDHARAQSLIEDAMPGAQASANRSGSGYVLSLLADVARAQGAYERAETLFAESMAGFTAMHDAWGVSYVLYGQALLATLRGRHREAAALFRISLEHVRALDDAWLMPQVLAGLAILAMRLGRNEPAARLLGAAERQRTAIGAAIPAMDRSERERALARARQLLGTEAFDAAWVIGQSMSVGQAVNVALALADELETKASAAGVGPLTSREQEVAALIARGFSNRQIATSLVISERTVHVHVASILSKLAFRSRAQVAVWAVEHGLGPGRGA